MAEPTDYNRVILFDGVCNLCNASVQFVIERDSKKQFFFASLQSETGQSVLQKQGLPTTQFKSLLLIEDGIVYTQSTAALKIARHLDGLWKAMYVFIIVPSFIRNKIYDFIAANRYKWFGKQESCWIPTPELKQRFLV